MANIWTFRNLTRIEDAALLALRNSDRLVTDPDAGDREWTPTDLDAFWSVFDASHAALLDGIPVAALGSIHWNVPGREAVIAPIHRPFLSAALGAIALRVATRWIFRAVVDQLLGEQSESGVTPTFCSFFMDVATRAPVQDVVLNELGFQHLGDQTIGGVTVAWEMRGDLYAMRAALEARDIRRP